MATALAALNLSDLALAFVNTLTNGDFYDYWYSDEQILTFIGERYVTEGIINNKLGRALGQLNTAITKAAILMGIDTAEGNNTHGIRRMIFTFKNNDNKVIKRSFYYVTSDKNKIIIPLSAKGAQELYNRVLHLSERCPKRPRTEIYSDRYEVSAIDTAAISTISTTITNNSDIIPSVQATGRLGGISKTLQPTNLIFNYWNSGDAKNLFRPSDNEHTIMTVHRLVKLCEQRAAQQINTSFCNKYLLLRKSYVVALEKMNLSSFRDCCSEAIRSFSEAGIATVSSPRTVMIWHRHFRVYHSLQKDATTATKEYQPKLFAVYPEARELINLYFSKDLETINVEAFRSHILDEVIPHLVQSNANRDGIGAEPLETIDFLAAINLKTIGLATAYKYLRYLGYKFDEAKKTYYNNGPEKPDQIEYRQRFIADYFDNELSCYLWVQIEKEAAIELENSPKNPLPRNISYDYLQNGQEMREYHIDAHAVLLDHVLPTNIQYGANLSVRKQSTTRPVLCVGEDESAVLAVFFLFKELVRSKRRTKIKTKRRR
jgi:hypothetical protein